MSQFVHLEKLDSYNDQTRLQKLNEKFSSSFEGKKVEFYCRSPGRVNIIGEHIDYCGYGVLPMAISQDILMAVSSNNLNKVRLVNTNDFYQPAETSLDDMEISQTQPKWQHYFYCGFKGVIEKIKEKKKDLGIDVVVDGCVPSCAGLSSSSALVCTAALATMTAYLSPTAFTKLELAEICQHCERYIGTEGGGMDQSIAFCAQEGKAKYVQFDPLTVTDVQLPEGVSFVIANSCVKLNKAATSHFNNRVAECRLAAQVLANKEKLEWRKVKKLAEVQQALKLSLEQCCRLVESHLTNDVYSKEDVCSMLGVPEEELNTISLSLKTYDVKEFMLKQRALHVFSESERVLKFKELCDKGVVGSCGDSVSDGVMRLGELMNDSHESCTSNYQCSCQDLDQLIQFAIKNGAIGGRLTGAGWGGCCVLMVNNTNKTALLNALAAYYSDKGVEEECFFATVPSKGASIIQI